jgi:hypothetical protein
MIFGQHSGKILLKYFSSLQCAALVAFFGTAEKFGAAIIAGKKFFFGFDKLFRPQLSPLRDGAQNIFLTLSGTGKFSILSQGKLSH